MYKSFEKTLPFSKIKLSEFIERIQSSSSNRDYITTEELLQSIPELNELLKGSLGLGRLLTDLMAKGNEESSSKNLPIRSLMLFGLLHCQSDPDEKASLFFKLIQKELKSEGNGEISMDDISKSEIFTELCNLASFGLFKVAENVDEADVGCFYDNDQLAQMKEKVKTLEV